MTAPEHVGIRGTGSILTVKFMPRHTKVLVRALHYITLRYTTLHSITPHYITLCNVTWAYTTLRFNTATPIYFILFAEQPSFQNYEVMIARYVTKCCWIRHPFWCVNVERVKSDFKINRSMFGSTTETRRHYRTSKRVNWRRHRFAVCARVSPTCYVESNICSNCNASRGTTLCFVRCISIKKHENSSRVDTTKATGTIFSAAQSRYFVTLHSWKCDSSFFLPLCLFFSPSAFPFLLVSSFLTKSPVAAGLNTSSSPLWFSSLLFFAASMNGLSRQFWLFTVYMAKDGV